MIPHAIGQVVGSTVTNGVPHLEVELREHTHEEGPLTATCIALSPFHGIGTDGVSAGDWKLPPIGADVLCFFPNVSIDGLIGDDLETGYALGVVPSEPEPLPEDDQGATPSDSQWVTVTPLDALSSFFQRGAAGGVRSFLQGTLTAIIEGVATATLKAASTLGVEANFTISGSNGAVVRIATDGSIQIDATTVELGAGTLAKLLNETAMATYNVHTHDNPVTATTFAPNQLMVADTDTTSETRAA